VQTWFGQLWRLWELVQPIGSNSFSVTALRGLRPETTFLYRPRASVFHEPANAILAALDPLAPQHLLDTPAAVTMAAFQENERILLTPIALVLVDVIVQAAAADCQSQAHFADGVAGLFGPHLGDHFVERGGCRPKMPKAF